MSIKGSAESYVKLRGSLYIPTAIVGKSAYEVAVANGFDGTEAEWLASLKGETGGKGDKGDKGDRGEKGERGAQGNAVVVYKFNDDLDESTFPEGRHYLYFNFETFEPVKAYDPNEDGDVERRAFKGISYGYDEGDEGGYYIAYITEDDLYAFVNSYSGNDTTAKFEDKAAMSIKVDTTDLPAEAEAFLNANAKVLEPLTLDSDIGKLDTRVSGIENELGGGNTLKFTFNDDLDESTFPEGYNELLFDFETVKPLHPEISLTTCRGIEYGWSQDEGGYFMSYLCYEAENDYTEYAYVLGADEEVAEFDTEDAKTIFINADTLTDEARAFLEANGTFEGVGLVDRVTALEKKIAELEEKVESLMPKIIRAGHYYAKVASPASSVLSILKNANVTQYLPVSINVKGGGCEDISRSDDLNEWTDAFKKITFKEDGTITFTTDYDEEVDAWNDEETLNETYFGTYEDCPVDSGAYKVFSAIFTLEYLNE